MNFAICDDDEGFIRTLQDTVEKYCAVKDFDCSCVSFADPRALLKADLHSIHALFLDIDMPELNGIEAAAKLREKYPDLIIVFVTAFIKYAPEGYKVYAFRYLLKENLQSNLFSCLDDMRKKLFAATETITLRLVDSSMQTRLCDILYFEGMSSRHAVVHLRNLDSIDCLGKLSDFEAELSSKGFLRIHKSYLVNMAHITSIKNYRVTLSNGDALTVPEKRYGLVRDAITLWEGNRL
jgi:DNA-binding LytR/AlgR family response regulator